MKKSMAFFTLLLITISGNAQVNKNPELSELDQDQLNLALTESLHNLKTARIFTLIGTGIGIAGTILLIEDSINTNNQGTDAPSLGSKLASIGILTVALALPRWVRHSKRKNEIELELAKFNTYGLASINGIGLKIRF
jgi:hypothetical protein